MVKNLDLMLMNMQMYDYRLLSTLGLTKEDVEYFSSQDGITAKGAINHGFYCRYRGTEKDIVLKAHSITDKINHLEYQMEECRSRQMNVFRCQNFFGRYDWDQRFGLLLQ